MAYAVGLDIGGTTIRGVVTNKQGKVIGSTKLRTGKTKKIVLENIKEILDGLFEVSDKKKIKRVGVGFAGFADENGKVIFSPNTPIVGCNLKQFVRKWTKKSVVAENDANCFVVAEHAFGAGRGYENIVGIVIGTGIGGGIIVNNKLYTGLNNSAGEVGHTFVGPDNNTKDVEYYASGRQLIKRYKLLGGKLKDPRLNDLKISKERIAKKVYQESYSLWARICANVIMTLNPQVVIIGGGVANDIDFPLLRKETKRLVIQPLAKNTKISSAKLGELSGAIGAARLSL